MLISIKMDLGDEYLHNRELFYNNPLINPHNGRRIKFGTKTYQDLVKQFGRPPLHEYLLVERELVPRSKMRFSIMSEVKDEYIRLRQQHEQNIQPMPQTSNILGTFDTFDL